MATSSRLARLKTLVQADLATLPDRKEPADVVSDDDDETGGVLIEPAGMPVLANTDEQLASPPLRPAPQAVENLERRFILVEGVTSSYNAGAEPEPLARASIAANTLPATDLQKGDLVSPGHHFAPIRAIAKYPYQHCNRQHSKDIASAFFDQGKFWQREWDLYYIWDVEPFEPLVLIRESQFQTLLEEINSHFKLSLRITNDQREDSLVARFPDHPDCRPRYLGRSHSREQFDIMVSNTPSKSFRPAGEQSRGPPDNGTLEQFKELMEELWAVQKAKSKANKAKKHQERLSKQKSMVDAFKRAQRYLGLRAREVLGGLEPPTAIDPSLQAPHSFDQSVVFVCVDVESYERAHHKITEIGVASLDTRDLKDIAPGQDGVAWRALIKAKHFRIKEHRHLINHAFVHGCPDRFDYGASTFVSLKEARLSVAACFQPPFSADASNTPVDQLANILGQIDANEKRNIVLLGHDTLSDIRYLQNLGYDPMKAENILETMDTATMYRVWRREQQSTNLGRILNNFDILGWNLHNAGNDAMFTVQIMLAICVREATIRGTPELQLQREQDKAARLMAAHEDADERAKANMEGWSDNENGGDGGAPVPLR